MSAQGDYLTKRICLPNGKFGTITKFREGKYYYRTYDNPKPIEINIKDIPSCIERYENETNQIPNSPLNQLAKQEFGDKKLGMNDEKEEKKNNNESMSKIFDCEIEWILSKRDLIFDKKQITIELDKEESSQLFNEIKSFLKKNKDIIKKYKIQSLIESSEKNIIENSFILKNGDNGDNGQNEKQISNGKYCQFIFGALNWQGVVSRWRDFIQFIQSRLDEFMNMQNSNNNENFAFGLTNAKIALREYGIKLGRVISYRALALTNDQYNKIVNSNEILPTGGLIASPYELINLVNRHGITRITVARLYIRYLSQWIGIDPSLSLHDDCETALCIAQTYMNEINFDASKKKPIYLFEMNVPKIHCIGWKVCDVQNKAYLVDKSFAKRKDQKETGGGGGGNDKESKRWFSHNKIWFDAENERTERQLLYTIPFLKQRCQKIEKIETKAKLLQRIEPFRIQQEKLKQESEQPVQK